MTFGASAIDHNIDMAEFGVHLSGHSSDRLPFRSFSPCGGVAES
jgi:hypothetical protein